MKWLNNLITKGSRRELQQKGWTNTFIYKNVTTHSTVGPIMESAEEKGTQEHTPV